MLSSDAVLMHRDIKTARLVFRDGTFRDMPEIYAPEHLPPGVTDAGTMSAWLLSRNMPKSRPFADSVFSRCGIRDGSGIPLIGRNASLTDCYWVSGQDFADGSESWDDVNPWTSGWDTDGEKLFAGFPELVGSLASPDFAVSGFLPKAWVREPDGMFLLKRDDDSGFGVFAEVASASVADMLGIPHVPYFYSYTEGELCAACPCILDDASREMFTLQECGILPEERELSVFYSDLGEESAYRSMQVLDFLIAGFRRKSSDMAFIRDSVSLEFLGTAPLYDHGDCFRPVEEGDMRSKIQSLQNGIRFTARKELDPDYTCLFLKGLGEKFGIGEEALEVSVSQFRQRAMIYNTALKRG